LQPTKVASRKTSRKTSSWPALDDRAAERVDDDATISGTI